MRYMPVAVIVSHSFERQPRHPEPPATELQHLGHERKRLQLPPFVERRQYLGLAAHLDDLADTESEQLLLGSLCCLQPGTRCR